MEESEEKIIDEIILRADTNMSKPLYNESIVIVESGIRYATNLLWPQKKVIFFLNDNKEDYEVAKNSDWKCYCTADPFDIDTFLMEVGE